MNEDGKVVIRIDMDTKNFDEQIEDAEAELEKLEKAYNETANLPLFAGQQEDLKNLRTQIEKTVNKLVGLKDAQDRLNQDDANPQKKINLLENLTKGAKKLAFGILGIRTAYTIIRKASSAYLETDTQTTNQLQANWTALGTFMETAIRYVSSLMKKLVTSILYFASVLTGVNYIEKANTAILKKQTKATQGLVNANNKLKASFDEIETIGENNFGAVDSGIDTSVLFDVSDIGENARTTIEKVAQALQPVYEILKKIIDYSVQHPDVILATLGGIAMLKTLSSIIGVAGAGATAGTGLAGIGSMLSYIAGFGVIAIEISVLYNTVKEARDATKNANDMTELWKNSLIDLNDTAKLVLNENKDTPEFIKNLSDRIKSHVDELIENTKEIEESRKKMNLFQMIISAITGDWDADTNKIIANYQAMKSDIETWEEAYKQGKLNDEQIKEYNETLQKYKKYLEDATYESNTHTSELRGQKGAFEDAQNELKKVKDRLKELNIETDNNTSKTNNATKKTQDYTQDIKKLDEKLKGMTGQVNDYNKALDNVKKDVTTKFNMDTTGAKNSINTLFDKLKTGILGAFGISFPTIRLAKGGIINQPGRGVPIGGAIAGEAGREAVLPLQDSQVLQEIADAIGSRITINATIPVYAYNRQVDRQMRRIQAEDDFARNR